MEVKQTVQANIGEKLWVNKSKDGDFSRLWESHGVASLSADKTRVFVGDEVSKKIWDVSAKETLPFDHCHDENFDDLTRMNYLHEASLLNNLQKRYMNDEIYTYFGDTLLSVNPYYDIPTLYDEDKHLDEDVPHVFSIAKRSYGVLQKKKRSQSIVINGDSGSGKTEAAKQIMRHLVSLCLKNSNSGTTPEIENLVLESTPVLEAFGNSVTLRNDNSSRFGRFIQIMYNDDGTGITGMNTLHFLLEKSRLIRRSPGERNYHIFYQCCASLKHLGFKDAGQYNYLLPLLNSQNYTGTVPDDVLGFDRTRNALLHIGIKDTVQQEIWKVLLAILSIGNIEFVTAEVDKDNTGRCRLAKASLEMLETAAQNLGIANAKELEIAMIQRTIEAGKVGEKTVIHLNVEQAKDSRDALAKFLYSAIFDWVVEELNRQSANFAEKSRSKKKDRFIGILDIFGFEDLEKNSFEQVCVNYANELLQRTFDFYIIESERRVFKEEGVDFPNIELPSIVNSEKVLDLLTHSLFSVLEEQCLLRSGTDESFFANITALVKGALPGSSQQKLSLDWKNKRAFIVNHFAGDVSYDCVGFVEKNRDALTTDLKELVQNNCSELLGQQIGSTPDERSRKMAAKETVLKKFQKEMNNLVSTIGKTDEIFIRCIKPNVDQASREWDVKLVLSQLEYLGIMQAIRVHEETYPIRRNFSFIAEKYNLLLDGSIKYTPGKNDLEVMKAILLKILGKDSERKYWQCGHTKVFLGNEVLYRLDHVVNERRLAALAAMGEDERRQKLEEDRLRQERELKAARERFEREKKEEEEKRRREEELRRMKEDEERRQRLEEDYKRAEDQARALREQEIRIKREEEKAREKLKQDQDAFQRKLEEEKKRFEEEARLKQQILQSEEAEKKRIFAETEAKLQAEEAARRRQWEEQTEKLQLEEAARLKKLEEDRAKFAQLSKQKQQELEAEELSRKQILADQERRLREDEEQKRKEWKMKLDELEKQEIIRQKKLEEQEAKESQDREAHRLRLLHEENRLKVEKESFLEKQKKEEEARLVLEEQQRVRMKELEEEAQRLHAQAERLKILEADRLLRLEEERKQRLADEQRKAEEERIKSEKEQAEREKQRVLREEAKVRDAIRAEKKAKLARRNAKKDAATRMQSIIRGAIIRSRYKQMIYRRRTFAEVIQPFELVVFASLVLNANSLKLKRRCLVLTSSKRIMLVHPRTLKVEDEANYDESYCKAVAASGGKELNLFLRKGDKQIQWKIRDLLNDTATWVAVCDTLTDGPTYIREGFYGVLGGRVSRKNIINIVKLGNLKVLTNDIETKSRISTITNRTSKAEKVGLLFILTDQDKKYTLTWYEKDKDESHTGQLPVDRRMNVVVPDLETSSVGGRLAVFVFCLKVKKHKADKLYTLQGRSKEDIDSWVNVLRMAIRRDKSRYAQLKDMPTLKRPMSKRSSFNAADFLNAFAVADKTTHQNLKHFGAKK